MVVLPGTSIIVLCRAGRKPLRAVLSTRALQLRDARRWPSPPRVQRARDGDSAAKSAVEDELNRCRSREKMHPAVLARAGLARKLRDQRAVGTLGEVVEESFHCRNVGETMQALTVHAKFAGRLRPPQHQHCEECRRLLRHVHHPFDVVRVSRNAFAAPLDGQKHAFQAVDRCPDVRLGCVEDRIAPRFLIAARDERAFSVSG